MNITWSLDKAFNGTVVNLKYHFVNGKSLKFACTVPFREDKIIPYYAPYIRCVVE